MVSTEKRWADIKKMELRREAFCKKMRAEIDEKREEKPARVKAKSVSSH
ncbi:MAG: hypothetical protein NWE85_02995 [Candidatus Bathyarchaeota archaeon]|nr:hypothetical protein [Candidatus Bathyarchaeota archaeon]